MQKIKNKEITNKSVGGDAHIDLRNKIAKKNVGENCVFPHSRGITLIALIITIIVMIILVGVTVNVALNGGLFGTTKKAAYQTEVSTIQEQLEAEKVTKIAENNGKIPSNFVIKMDDLPISDELKTKYGTKLVISSDGNLYYNPEEVTDEEERAWLEEIGINAYTGETAGAFEKYVLGETPGQKNLQTILNMETMTFIDEEETISNASTAVKFLTIGQNEDLTKVYIYAKYEEVAYKIICDTDTYMTESVEEIYRKQGYEGRDLGELKEGYDGWTIIYDNGDGTVEAVSPTVMAKDGTPGPRLGYSEGTTDQTQRVEEAIASYNSAIDTINEYCRNLEGLPSNEGVRSVGAATDPRPNLEGENAYNGIPAEWKNNVAEIYNGRGKAGDTAYEQDLVRMSYYDVADCDTDYWMASRCVYSGSSSVDFNVLVVATGGLCGGNDLWNVYSSGRASGDRNSYVVRPVIRVSGV